MIPDRRGWGACVGFVLVAALYFWPVLRCHGSCAVDLQTWAGERSPIAELAQADTRLNTWILAWVQHALVTKPTRLFDANAFHPAPHALAGSEHMLSTAILGLPLRPFFRDATAGYNAVLTLSFIVAGAATYALGTWLTGSAWIGACTALMAMFMPWRLTELSHLQLLFAAWLPLVWLGVARCCFEGATAGRLTMLAAVWSALVFASYYLAYIGCFSAAAMMLAIAATGGIKARDIAKTAAALAVPLIVLAALSLPYLDASRRAELVQTKSTIASIPPGMIIEALAPLGTVAPRLSLPWNRNYSLPTLVVLLAACALLPAARPRRAAHTRLDDGSGRPAAGGRAACTRAVLAGLLATCAVALVMSLGQRLRVGSIDVGLPALWAARIVPGFELMRAPLRWLLAVHVALPALAAIGLRKLEVALGRGAAIALAVAALVALIPPRLPTMAAYPHEGRALDGYRALEGLPAGPVLEIPWPHQPQANASSSSMFMVASTYHWRPLLNGYTAYKPRSYPFLVRAASRLPDRAAVERMSALTGLRWIVVHLGMLEEWERTEWEEAPLRGPLAAAYRDEETVIYEVVDWERGGRLAERLFTDAHFADTISGLARDPLVLDSGSGTLSAQFPLVLNRYADGWANQSVPVRITNATGEPWPAIDPDPAGLVQVRYALRDAGGRELAGAVVALDDDVPARGSLLTQVLVEGQLEEGSLRLGLELVQSEKDGWRALGIAPLEGEARVVSVKTRR